MVRKKHAKWISILWICLLATSLLTGCFQKKQQPQDKGQINIEQKEETKQGKTDGPGDGEEQQGNDEEEQGEDVKEGIFPGDRAYDFSLMDREGNQINLSSLRGKVVLINFWTTWCKYCIDEMPDLQEVYDQYKDKGVAILAVNILPAEAPSTEIKDVNKFLDDRGLTFPVLYDVEGTAAVKYKVRGFPTTYILDEKGIIVDLVTGAMSKEAMIEKIEYAKNR